jgi:hypothetical protein
MEMDHGMDMQREMSGPAGIPLATGEDDPDGLEMDVLHVSVGPILQYWPAGLVLHCILRGDVIDRADAVVIPAATTPPSSRSDPRYVAADLLDRAAGLLSISGQSARGQRVRILRDDAVATGVDEAFASRLERVRTQLSKGVAAQRWMDIPTKGRPTDQGLAPTSVATIVDGWLTEAIAAATALDTGSHAMADRSPSLTALSALVAGREFAMARLLVAASGFVATAQPTIGGKRA